MILGLDGLRIILYSSRFPDSDRSLNRKRERFKVFEIEPRSNHDDVIINLIIILNIYINIKLVKNRKIN